jgi:hypothetical protein
VFPFGGPPAFLPAPVTSRIQPVSANGVFPDILDFRTPYVHQYSFGIQNEFAKNWTADVSYVGSAGRKLLRTIEVNQPAAPSASAIGALSPGLSSLVVAGFGVHLVQSSANSSYNSLQAGLTKRMSNGLQYAVAYTYGHSIDDYSGDPSGTSDISVVPGNQLYLDNRGSSDFDRRHRFVFSGIYDFPKFHKGGLNSAALLLNGWEVAGILIVQSGTPFSVLTDATAFVQARADLNPAISDCNPNLSGTVVSRLNNYFNVACFIPATARGDFGTAGRNLLVGPGQKNVDISASKFFPMAERSLLEFRAEFFNSFNNVNFANPVNILASANVGTVVVTTTGPRVVQIALKFSF